MFVVGKRMRLELWLFEGFREIDQANLMLARYYSASLGRFMAVDPGGDTQPEDPQSWNKYAYVRNNPINAIDPDGRFSDWALTNEYKVPAGPSGPVSMEDRLETVGELACVVKVGSLVLAGIAGIGSGGAGAAPFLGVATWAGRVEAGADLAKAAIHPSMKNGVALGMDAIGAGSAAAVGGVLSAAKVTGKEAGKAIGEAIGTAATAAAPAMSQVTAPRAPQPQRPLIITTPSGGDNTAVDQRINNMKERAARGPEKNQ